MNFQNFLQLLLSSQEEIGSQILQKFALPKDKLIAQYLGDEDDFIIPLV